MVLDENAENNVLTFTYKGSSPCHTVHYVDAQTGEQIHSGRRHCSQTLNPQNVSAREIDGYTLQGDSTGYVSADQLEYTFLLTQRTLKHLQHLRPQQSVLWPETGDAAKRDSC